NKLARTGAFLGARTTPCLAAIHSRAVTTHSAAVARAARRSAGCSVCRNDQLREQPLERGVFRLKPVFVVRERAGPSIVHDGGAQLCVCLVQSKALPRLSRQPHVRFLAVPG